MTKIRNQDLLKLLRGLRGLDGVRMSRDEVRFFEFDEAVYWKIAGNLKLAEDAAERYEQVRKQLVRKHGIVDGEQVTPKNAERVAAFMEELDQLRDREVRLELAPLSRTELSVKKNRIPATTLNDLSAIITE